MKKKTECVTFLLVIFTWPSGLMKQQGFIVHLLCAKLSCGIGWQRPLNHSLCPQGINNRAESWNWKSQQASLCPLNVPELHQVSYVSTFQQLGSVSGIQLARAFAHSCAHFWHTCWAPVKPSGPVKVLNLLTDSNRAIDSLQFSQTLNFNFILPFHLLDLDLTHSIRITSFIKSWLQGSQSSGPFILASLISTTAIGKRTVVLVLLTWEGRLWAR